MSWNHRVMRLEHRNSAGEAVEVTFGVYEVYYDNETHAPNGHSAFPTDPIGETLAELREDIARFAAALEKPVLEWDEASETYKIVAA